MYEKPFKLNWQHSVVAGAFGGIYSQRNEQTDYKTINTDGKTFYAYAGYSLGYFPNTRTNIRVTALQQISKYIEDDERNSMSSFTSLTANLYYYFSPNLRLAGNCNLRYLPIRYKLNEGQTTNRNDFSSAFTLQLTYFIF